MKFSDITHETYAALSANKVRSGLTILGIVIGISSVIAMVSIGTGASNTISSSIESLGSNLIQITPGAQQMRGFGASSGRGGAKTLTNEDAQAIAEQVADVEAVDSQVSSRYQITAKGTNTNTSVTGVTANYSQIRNVEVAEGSFISDTQNNSASKVAVLGPTTRDDLFGEGTNAIGQAIRINGLEFKIIGVTVAKGGTGFQNQDDIIYIPVRSAQRYLSGDQYLTTIAVQATTPEVMTQVQADIILLLLDRHKISDAALADFSVLNQNDILSTASSVTSTLTYLLAAIGGISLLVGGIGIMNMMLTTVTERTREIGLRKAIGAKKSDIRAQFLAEAVALTVIGGVVGIALGWLISFAVNLTGLVTTSVSLSSVLLAFGVSAITGIVFGYYPARRAAELNPIEALRYE
ncbi:MAG: ABC transporter, permease protein [Candidatus Kaiserbacteria bacterium GW2011_GWB1_52_6]|uniref:ABC transporter, permease protein n=3 Tax=Candidatus Kaiseribacteriota TaxID=1752734 RepID=A0A0G1XKQ8_9BACT|nr:MAG: ABC transporter, permease protein [Candidatus Kaiserbacteria bacterium GW2011_GWA2_52_12]KKW27807.1 MAG: ABC transporter, permease protein [Candidatus Kaiserbacteria bacterium GW2011_GWB1_52_6]KKW31838.1 MAG: ABC transporter, permease protein [Candidatus Kaiserbacteria bacterium GW2011_GWC2_52_8b]